MRLLILFLFILSLTACAPHYKYYTVKETMNSDKYFIGKAKANMHHVSCWDNISEAVATGRLSGWDERDTRFSCRQIRKNGTTKPSYLDHNQKLLILGVYKYNKFERVVYEFKFKRFYLVDIKNLDKLKEFNKPELLSEILLEYGEYKSLLK